MVDNAHFVFVDLSRAIRLDDVIKAIIIVFLKLLLEILMLKMFKLKSFNSFKILKMFAISTTQ